MSDKQHVMGAAASASEPALLASLPEPVPVSASGDGQAQEDDEAKQFAANMKAVGEMQAEYRNPVTQVAFRAGFIACREIMARFVEQGGDTSTAASIRANWLPELGDDPGAPRLYDWDETVEGGEEGPWIAKPLSAALEGRVYAWLAMHQFGIIQQTDGSEG